MRSAWLGMLGVLALACNGGSEGDEGQADDGTTDDLPSPYAETGADTGVEVPPMQPDEMIGLSVTAMRTFITLEPDAVADAYEAMMVFEDECPEEQMNTVEGENSVTLWFTEGCTTSTGLELRGGARFERYAFEEDGRMVEGAAFSSEGTSMRLATADGRWLEMTGGIYYERGTSADANDSYFEVGGQIAADPTTAAASALMDPELSAQGVLYSYSDGTLEALGGEGSMSGPLLGNARAFQFSDMFVLPQECATELAATFSIRDAEGFWHDIVFDAATIEDNQEPVFDAAKCDGCGAYVAAGAVLGEACLNEAQVASFFDWQGFPW